MPVFNKADDYKLLKNYPKLLHKALSNITADEPVNFVYLKNFEFETETKKPMPRPLVVVDCSSSITGGLGLRPGERWAAKGSAKLTPEGKVKFEPVMGKVLTLPLQRFLKELRKDMPEIEVDLDEEDGPTPPRPTQVTIHPPVRPALPNSASAQENFVEEYITALTASKFPVDADTKARTLKDAQLLCNKGEYGKAVTLLNNLVKHVTYPGVPNWALNQVTRRYEVEMLTEQYVALIALVDMKSTGAEGAQMKKTLLDKNKKVDQIGQEIRKHILHADPIRVKEAFDEWVVLVKYRETAAQHLRKLWLPDQTARADAELGALPNKGANSDLAGMLTQYGKVETLELAQMAEIQSLEYQKTEARKSPPVTIPDYHKMLNVAELGSVFGYSTANYTPINKMLRNAPASPADQKAIDDAKLKFAAYIKSAESGLAKLPVYAGSVIRCNKTLWQGFIDDIVQNGSFTEPSFMSAAKAKASGFGDIVIHIAGNKTGRDISMFSMHQTEGEILFPPGATFQFFGGEAVVADGTVKKFITPAEFKKCVTLNTRVAKLSFRQK